MRGRERKDVFTCRVCVLYCLYCPLRHGIHRLVSNFNMIVTVNYLAIRRSFNACTKTCVLPQFSSFHFEILCYFDITCMSLYFSLVAF